MNPKKTIIYLLFILNIIFLAASCGNSSLGYGVNVWPGSSIPENTILAIIDSSEIRNSFTIKSTTKESIEISKDKIVFFRSKREAQKFLDACAPYLSKYAKVIKDRHPVRLEPAANSDVCYTLKEDEILKILDQQNKKITIGKKESYWYKVITQNSVIGWSFGGNLEVYDRQSSGSEIGTESDTNESNIMDIISKPLRPDYYGELLKNKMVDLTLISEEYGFFADINSKTVTINLPKERIVFNYSSITFDETTGKHVFNDTTLRIAPFDSGIIADYFYKNASYSNKFITINNLAEIITTEQKYREDLFGPLKEKEFSSAAYGKIRFDSNKNFKWEGFDKLVPSVIPSSSCSEGFIKFDLFVSDILSANWDRAITFSYSASERKSVFLYKWTGRGFKMMYIPASLIKDGQVKNEPNSPTVIYFEAN